MTLLLLLLQTYHIHMMQFYDRMPLYLCIIKNKIKLSKVNFQCSFVSPFIIPFMPFVRKLHSQLLVYMTTAIKVKDLKME